MALHMVTSPKGREITASQAATEAKKGRDMVKVVKRPISCKNLGVFSLKARFLHKATTGSKKRKRGATKTSNSCSRSIYKLLKLVHPEVGVASKAKTFKKIASEAARVARFKIVPTIPASLEIEMALSLVLTGELAKHTMWEEKIIRGEN